MAQLVKRKSGLGLAKAQCRRLKVEGRPSMPKLIEIENIEEMRLREGIVDVELRDQIRGLQIGDLVKVTLLAMAKSGTGETVLVQITSIRGNGFRGKLTRRPVSVGLSKLRAGLPIAFTKAHIHSIPKEQLTHEPR